VTPAHLNPDDALFYRALETFVGNHCCELCERDGADEDPSLCCRPIQLAVQLRDLLEQDPSGGGGSR
jgi:hypothetical protein